MSGQAQQDQTGLAALARTWATYQSAWGPVGATARQALIGGSVDPACVYTDPASISAGYAELTAKMEATQRNFPGAAFRSERFTTHHGQAISHWTMHDGGGTAIFTGVSWARFGDDGRLTSMTGFFEPVP